MLIQKILLELLNKKLVFTDLNVRAGEIVKIRTPSGWGRFGNEPVAREEINSFLTVIAGANWLNRLQNSPTQSLDIAKTIGGAARLRCNIAFSGSLDENEDHQMYKGVIRFLLDNNEIPYNIFILDNLSLVISAGRTKQ